MKKPQITPVKIAPATITYINGKAQVEMTISKTKLTDWASKQALQNMIDFKTRTFQTLRSTNRIPCTKIGNKIFHYVPASSPSSKITSSIK